MPDLKHVPQGGPPAPPAEVHGWLSAALGVPQVAAPGRFLEAIGIKPDTTSRVITVAVGVRELMAAAGILRLSQPPTAWLWARVAGDTMDLALLGAALAGKPKHPERTRAAAGIVGTVMVLDLLAAIKLTRSTPKAASTPESTSPEAAAAVDGPAHVTIRGERAEIERRWASSPETEEIRDQVDVTFKTAPRNLGTEVRVERKGADDRVVRDALRRFKQIVETGEVLRSDGTPEGHSAARQLKQRPAQPVAAGGDS